MTEVPQGLELLNDGTFRGCQMCDRSWMRPEIRLFKTEEVYLCDYCNECYDAGWARCADYQFKQAPLQQAVFEAALAYAAMLERIGKVSDVHEYDRERGATLVALMKAAKKWQNAIRGENVE